MKCLTLPNPWASCSVFGVLPFINRLWAPERDETILIRSADTPDNAAYDIRGFEYHNAQHHAYGRIHCRILGTVDVHGTTDLEDCQIPGALGPVLWSVNSAMVAMNPARIVIEEGWVELGPETIGIEEDELLERLDLKPPGLALRLINQRFSLDEAMKKVPNDLVHRPSRLDPQYYGD